jgi:hypothetical protein
MENAGAHASGIRGTKDIGRHSSYMAEDDRTGNEPSPLLLVAAGVIPLLAVAAWFAFS